MQLRPLYTFSTLHAAHMRKIPGSLCLHNFTVHIPKWGETRNEANLYLFLLLPGNNDFTPINNLDVGPFSNTQRRQCFSVEIIDDMIREDMETFFLVLTTRPGEMLNRVTISPDEAEVTINDDDRESSSVVVSQHNRSHTVLSLL